MSSSYNYLSIPRQGEWSSWFPTAAIHLVFMGIGAFAMNAFLDYVENHKDHKKFKMHRFPPTGGSLYFDIPPMEAPQPQKRFVLASQVFDIQLEPTPGHVAWYTSPGLNQVRVPLKEDRAAVKAQPGMCYDGRVEMWWDGADGVGLVRL
ncbi:hypothetical protein TWF730_007972 [Orbilia blumenaviensis]|uniref:Uncharacterized protein n=1 Tax=Orbilia blumenaviensis TaxID=1796055 RepID=A0AAV9VC49_9PEZI